MQSDLRWRRLLDPPEGRDVQAFTVGTRDESAASQYFQLQFDFFPLPFAFPEALAELEDPLIIVGFAVLVQGDGYSSPWPGSKHFAQRCTAVESTGHL